MKTLLAFSFLLAFSILFSSAYAQEIPTLTPYVTDLANVIDSSYETMINDYASQLEATTTAEIAVLTVDSTLPLSIDQYAVEVFEENGIGQADKDNGVLVVVAIQDRQWRLEIGYGVEGDINDAKAGRIGRTYIVPYFQQEQYGEGLYLTVKTIGDIIAGDQELSEQFDEGVDTSTVFFLMIMFIGLLALIFVPTIATRFCPKCHSWMKAESKKEGEICYICKKCGYKKCVKKGRHVPFFFFVGGGGHGGGGGYSGGGFGGGSSGGAGSGGSW